MEEGLAIIFAMALLFGVGAYLLVWYADKKSGRKSPSK